MKLRRPFGNKFLTLALQPQNTVLLTVLLSLLAWLLPTGGGLRRGFQHHERITFTAVAVLSIWYACIYLSSFLGFETGKKLAKNSPLFTLPVEHRTHRIFAILALVGTIGAYLVIYRSGALGQYLASSGTTSANALKEALYEDYSVGLLSLRYVSVIAAGFTCFRYLVGYRINVWDALGLLALLAASFITGRILITWTICIAAGLLSVPHMSQRRPRQMKTLITMAFCAALALWVLNYSRNLLYYRDNGSDNFATAGLAEAMAYLGTPMQVSIGVANQWTESELDTSNGDDVDHEGNLTTNSAFAELLPEMGAYAFGFISLQCFAFASLAGWASKQHDSFVFCIYPVVLYGFAELWRIDILRFGIFFCLTAISVMTPMAIRLGPRLGGNRRRTRRVITERSKYFAAMGDSNFQP